MSSQKENKTAEDARKFFTMVAEKQGWKLNSDTELLDILAYGLAKNYSRYGYYSCPCRDADGVRERDRDIVCPCKYCVPDQEVFGHCYCGLYLTLEFHKSGSIPKAIPERRPE